MQRVPALPTSRKRPRSWPSRTRRSSWTWGACCLKLEAVQAERIQAAMKGQPAAPKMSDQEEAEATALLKSPDLMGRILADFDACGLVGEGTNKLVAYLAAVSRSWPGRWPSWCSHRARRASPS